MSKKVVIPGDPIEKGTAFVDTTTAAIQGFAPVNKIHQHLCAYHFYAHDMTRQLEAHHFCSHQNEEMHQCLIYDGPTPEARLIGVEYIVSERLFLTLPDEEKKLWHSHEYEVKSGVLFMPGLPGPIQRTELEKVCKTYGKVYHFWQTDLGHELPTGIPQLMMALTKDGQLHDHLAKEVENLSGVSLEKEKSNREKMSGPEFGIHPLANGGGKGLKMALREVDIKPVAPIPSEFL